MSIKKKLKIIFIGDAGVGKSSIINYYYNSTFNNKNDSTIGVAYHSKIIKLNHDIKTNKYSTITINNSINTNIMLQIWDTAGQERYRTLVPIYYKNSNIVFFVIDNNDYNNIQKNIKYLSDIIKTYLNLNITYVILLNKFDILSDNNIDIQYINRWFNQFDLYDLDLLFFKTSAKTGLNINNAFLTSIIHHLNKYNTDEVIQKTDIINFKNTKKNNSNFCCII